MNNQINIFEEEFQSESGDIVKGVTIVIDGKFKQVLDTILKRDSNYTSYLEIISAALIKGVGYKRR